MNFIYLLLMKILKNILKTVILFTWSDEKVYDIYTIFLLLRKDDMFKIMIDNNVYTHDDLTKILNKDNKFYFTFSDFYNFVKDKNVKIVR